jgi:hypothetical protein
VSFYRWAMRNASMVLFIVSVLIFVVSFANYFFLSGAAMNRALSEEGLTSSKFVLFWGAIAQAFGSSVWPFLGAGLLYRLDRRWSGEAPPK